MTLWLCVCVMLSEVEAWCGSPTLPHFDFAQCDSPSWYGAVGHSHLKWESVRRRVIDSRLRGNDGDAIGTDQCSSLQGLRSLRKQSVDIISKRLPR